MYDIINYNCNKVTIYTNMEKYRSIHNRGLDSEDGRTCREGKIDLFS